MPKNKGKKTDNENRILFQKDDSQEYAKIIRMLGDRRIRAILTDGKEILAIIPGRFRKRCWMKIGDIIVVSCRDFQEDRYDVIHKYNEVEGRKLVKIDEIPSFFLDVVDNNLNSNNKNATSNYFNTDDTFDFDDI